MAYCTLAQLITRYSERLLIEISDRSDAPTGTIDADLIERAITDSDALIDGHLKARYALPLADIPTLLTDLSLQISIYKAHTHVAGEKITKDHDAALKTLRLIADGTVRLDVAGVEPASSGSSDVMMTETERSLTNRSMRGYI